MDNRKERENKKLQWQMVDICYKYITNTYTEPYYFMENSAGVGRVEHTESYAYVIVNYMVEHEITELYKLKLVTHEDDDGGVHYWLSLDGKEEGSGWGMGWGGEDDGEEDTK